MEMWKVWSMETMERTSTEVYVDRIGSQHRDGCDGGRIWFYIIKGNHWVTSEDVAIAHDQ